MSATRKSAAFTLVELLVVIGIIAALVALLLPSLQKARSKAQAAACLSNMRQISNAIRMYCAEHNDLIPPFADYDSAFTRLNVQGVNLPAGAKAPLFRSDVATTNYAYCFADYIYPYLKTKNVFYCPVNAPFPGYPQDTRDFCQYGMNRWVSDFANRAYGYVTFGRAPNKFGKIRRTSEVVLLGEPGIGARVMNTFCTGEVHEFFYNAGTDCYKHGKIAPVSNGFDPCYWGYQNSTGGANMIFCDGSGRFMNGDTPGVFSSSIYTPPGATPFGSRADSDPDTQRLWIPWIK